MNAGLGGRLPEPPTSFVGREAELDALSAALADCRLLTIAGGAGLGKTRLAVALGTRQAAVPVRFVGLAELDDGTLVPEAVAAGLDVPDEPGTPAATAVVEHIGTRSLLLVLDNCEHLVEASAGLVESMLYACPELRVLVTSRQPLRVPGEVVWRISPLGLPDARGGDDLAAVAASESVRLLTARAQAALPGFRVTADNASTVAALCRRLEGIPLAIELAAVRLSELSIEEVLARLEDRFRVLGAAADPVDPRHRTLEAALDWSHQLLGEPERRIFRRVSVFSGGFDLEAAEAVCAGDGIEPVDVPRLVVGLVAKSLVAPEIGGPGPTRYRLLETVRQYGAHRLRESVERVVLRERHAGHFLALAARAAGEERGPEQPRWLQRLESDLDNFRTALAWLQVRDAGAWLRLATALAWFWTTRGLFSEGREWLAGALAAAGEDEPARAEGLLALARVCFWQGDYAAARSSCVECLDLSSGPGDAVRAGWALALLGSIHAYAGEFAASRAAFERALSGAGDVLVRMEALVGRGEMLLLAGDPAAAQVPLQEIAQLERGPEAPRGRAALFAGLAALFAGDVDAARARLDRAVQIFHRLGNRYGAAAALDALASVAVHDSDPLRALRLSGAASALRESTRSQLAPRWREVVRTLVVEPALAATGGRGEAAWADGRAMTFDEALTFARPAAAGRVGGRTRR
ncbi:MAG: tetratricopeptide repeat protein [Chloroflexi bacterium]|nr:MAG: tetratricopeptide repeat protein [Chloroflexota bacterium]